MRSFSVLAVVLAVLFVGSAMAQGRQLTVVTLEFSPYVSETLPNNGWAWEVAETAFESQGYQASLWIVPWARAVSMTRQGQVDALYLANINDERRDWAVFSEPIGEEISVAFKHRNRHVRFEALSDLARYSIGALRDAHVTNRMRQAGLTVHSVSELEQGFDMLYHGRLDLLVTDRYVGQHLLNTLLPPPYADRIDHAEKPIDANRLHLAVSRNVPDHLKIREDFNRGLQEIRETGVYRAILRKHGF